MGKQHLGHLARKAQAANQPMADYLIGAVAREGSVANAARALGVTPQAIYSQLRKNGLKVVSVVMPVDAEVRHGGSA